MIKYHNPKENTYKALDLSEAISGHTADETIAYKEVNGESIYMGYFFPASYDRRKIYPVFIMVHGGAWGSHMIFMDQPHWQGDYLGYLCRYYAEKGFICVSLDYRLVRDNGQAENYGIRECYEDCCDGLDHIIRTAADYGIDTDRMYLLGESAGGHLAGALATFHYDRRYRFRKAFLINPITYFDDPKWRKYVPMSGEVYREIEALSGAVYQEVEQLSGEMYQEVEALSPFYQIDGDTSEVVLIHGEDDKVVSTDHSRKFYERMREFARDCELHLIEKTNHAFLLAEYSKETAACKIAVGIINETLDRE